MALIEYSSLVTAPDASKVNSYNLTLSNKVDANITNVNDEATVYYEKIKKNYSNINTYFNKIGDEFIAAKKNVTGADLKSKLQALGKACKNQGQYCLSRKNELTNYFEFAALEQKIQDLENAISRL